MTGELNFLLRGVPLPPAPVPVQKPVPEPFQWNGSGTALRDGTGAETREAPAEASFDSAPLAATLPLFEPSDPTAPGCVPHEASLREKPPAAIVDPTPLFPCPPFEVLTLNAELERALPILLERPLIAVDIETIGDTLQVATDPRRAVIRLVSLSVPDYPTLVIDCASIDVRRLAPVINRAAAGDCRLVAHNAAFEQAFFRQNGFRFAGDASWVDTMLIAQLLAAGSKEGYINNAGLSDVVKRELGYRVDKTYQAGPWGGELSLEQHAYSAIDSACLLPLADRFRQQLMDARLQRVFRIESQALPFIVWTDLTGVPFDKERWGTLASEARSEAERLWGELDALVGPIDTVDGKGTINWRSAQQVLAQLRDHGFNADDTQDSTLASFGPGAVLPATLREYRKQQGRASKYASKYVEAVNPVDGRVHPRLNQLGASASGRMSASKPPIQGLPRDPRYRGCVRPSDPRNVVVKCDYASIELRLAAQISGDRRLSEAFRNGQDVLSLTAQLLLGAGAEVTSEQRQYAKAIAYGSLYGAGPATLQRTALKNYGVVLDEGEARALQERFFTMFRGLKRWQNRLSEVRVLDSRTLAGRRRLNVWSYAQRLNTPVQGSGADGMKNALGLLWQRRHQAPSSVRPILLVHDEVTIECARDDADAAAAWLSTGMHDGMSEFITDLPVVVGTTIGQSWAGEPLPEDTA